MCGGKTGSDDSKSCDCDCCCDCCDCDCEDAVDDENDTFELILLMVNALLLLLVAATFVGNGPNCCGGGKFNGNWGKVGNRGSVGCCDGC